MISRSDSTEESFYIRTMKIDAEVFYIKQSMIHLVYLYGVIMRDHFLFVRIDF